eukprot:CAMPEP_0181128024 /NCGR_PEP_ID=MMETSP1071-20121207/28524_1 /TAXON_ID=35127 /ORGANISM="Thalassiosira sp., Strain NH16" /LENGTH=549 /DNA_ID=CAMNT_0023213829 /DNA_START=319 /DNA_END=1969 /DNA_ORIENTATION=+
MKGVMKRITTQVEELDEDDAGDVLEKEYHDAKRKKKKMRKGGGSDRGRTSSKKKAAAAGSSSTTNGAARDEEHETSAPSGSVAPPSSSKRVLKRKRFHNFCPNILAHDFLSYRRVDRIFHRATIRVQNDEPRSSSSSSSGSGGGMEASALSSSVKVIKNRPFIVFSLTGDLFLQEQAVRIVGLLIAICRGLIDDDIIDCIFDEEFTSLVPAPPAPHIGLLSGEATYMTWEGRMKTILNARRTDRYSKGWNEDEVVATVEEWERDMVHDVARGWYCGGEEEDGRLKTETRWLEDVLHPWARRTKALLHDYRGWKASQKTEGPSFLPPLGSINPDVPQLFEKVLYHLREADKSGLWPSTTPNRQLVMLSTTSNEDDNPLNNTKKKAAALSVAHMKAKKNSQSRQSAYSFTEGEGGASGSFSVGAMPGEQCAQPKGNSLFPNLVRAAFELEIALRPIEHHRENRNAQFRPHTDNGAGAGQSTSLIVGLGTYVGGELVVEGERRDIRYEAIEFDGWNERHWTLPFQGERYSLVWFTPKGCEGVRGIDLDLPTT